MALCLIRCVGMTEAEMDAAADILRKNPQFERVGFNISGTANEEDIKALEAKGLIVEVIPGAPSISWLEPDQVQTGPELLSAEADSTLRTRGDVAMAGRKVYVVQFDRVPTTQTRMELEALGINLGAYVPHYAYKVVLAANQVQQLEALPSVRRVVPFSPALTLRRMAPLRQAMRDASERDPNGKGGEDAMFHIRCHDEKDLYLVYDLLKADTRVLQIEQGRNRLRIWAKAGDTAQKLCGEIAALEQVSVVEPYEYPTSMLHFSRQVLGITDSAGKANFPWNGKNQIIGVADSGIDTRHPDLKDRIKKLIERVAPSGRHDPEGHGTHVCSIIAGTGVASEGRLKGVAPAAKLVVQGCRDSAGRNTGFPVNLGDLLREAYDEGARIHNDSWGVGGAALYTSDDREVDMFVYDHPDFLVVVAAGNEARQPNPLDPSDPLGRIASRSLTSPACAKNALTVGACCSTRLDGPYQGKPWKLYPGSNAPQLPKAADEPICGNADVLAAFSSRGPVDDRRIKPDLLAPGTVVLAAKSSVSSLTANPEFGGHYAFQSGTSMAAPAIAGAAAIVRQYYIEERRHNAPSAALLKATLVNGAFWINAELAKDDRVGEPNYHQGFGRLDLTRTLPVPGNADRFTLRFVDVDRNAADALDSSIPVKQTWRKRIRVASAKLHLRLTLCWTDHPAKGPQNQFDFVVRAPSGEKRLGNQLLKRTSDDTQFDHINNVQRIVIDNPEVGDWLVMVLAANTTFPPQGFSLVATGADLSDFF